MQLYEKIEKSLGLFFILAIIMGLLFSDYSKTVGDYVMYLLMIILFLIFLKIDLKEILSHIRRPVLLGYILLMNLAVLPLLIYLLSLPFEKDIIIGLLLLASLPTGTAAAALTDIIKGRTSLTLLIAVLSSFIVPLTLPSIFYFLLGAKIELDYPGLFLTTFWLVFIPLVIAQLAKQFFIKHIEKSKKYYSSITVILASLIVLGVIGKEAGYILSNTSEILNILLILYMVFFVFQLAGYFMVFWLKKDEKIAVSVSKTMMNPALGVVLASTFFSSKVALILILSEIPWSTILIFFKLYKKYLP